MGFKDTLNTSSNLNTHRCEAGGFLFSTSEHRFASHPTKPEELI